MTYNIDRINKIKRENVIKALEFVEKENVSGVIDKVILFGSCVTNVCTEESDLDVCLVSKYNAKNDTFFRIFGGFEIASGDVCDVTVYDKIGEKLRKEIDKNGVVIYERD